MENSFLLAVVKSIKMIATHLSRWSNWLLDLVKDEHKNLSSRSLRCFKNSICIVYSGAHPWEMQPIPTLSKPLLIDSYLNLTLIWPDTTLKQQVLRLQNQVWDCFIRMAFGPPHLQNPLHIPVIVLSFCSWMWTQDLLHFSMGLFVENWKWRECFSS